MGLMAPSATLMARASLLLHQLLAGHELRIAAQQNIGAAAGHVGGDGHHPQPPGLGHNLRLALVELGVQHHVLARPCAAGSPKAAPTFSIDAVPTSTGCPFSCSCAMSSATALYFSFSVR